MKIYHPPLLPPVSGGKVPSPLVGEGQGIFVPIILKIKGKLDN